MELKPGYKQTEVGVIPEDWDIKNIGNISEVKTGPFGTALHEKDYVDNGTPIITVEHLGEYGVDHSNLPMVSDEDKKRLKSYTLKVGDIAFSRVGSIDRNALIRKKEDGWLFSGRLLRVRVNNEKYDSRYLSYYFHSESFKQRIRGVAVGQTMPSLNTAILKGVKVVLPEMVEQTTIANVLSDTDALIQSLTRLIAKKRQIKQGVMQTLLNPYENGRLKEGWVVKKLGELCNPSSVRINPITEKKIYKCIELEHIDQGSGRLLGHVSSNHQLSQKALFKKGDVLFGKLRPYLKKYLFAEFDGVCSTEIWVLKSENGVSSLWLYYLVQSEQIVEAANQSTGTKMPRAEWRVVKNTEVNFPSPLNEQTRIATILANMDAEIAALEAKLAKYRQVKQGMMQNLLTGRIRLVKPESNTGAVA